MNSEVARAGPQLSGLERQLQIVVRVPSSNPREVIFSGWRTKLKPYCLLQHVIINNNGMWCRVNMTYLPQEVFTLKSNDRGYIRGYLGDFALSGPFWTFGAFRLEHRSTQFFFGLSALSFSSGLYHSFYYEIDTPNELQLLGQSVDYCQI